MKNTRVEAEKRPRFWWHWQNLKEDYKGKGIHGRAWLHNRPRGVFGVEWHLPSWDFHVRITVGGGNDQLGLSLACGLFALYFSFEQWALLKKWDERAHWQGLETSLSIYNWSIHWKVWTPEHEWSSSTPKWRDGWFNIPDFFLGRNKYTKVDQKPIPAVVSLPEGDYPVTVIFFTQTWKRPRWPVAKIRKGGNVDIEHGIPIPGKGESSWDCTDGAYMSIGTSAMTVEEAIADVIERVNERRIRYGGKNWKPASDKGKPPPDPGWSDLS